MNYKKKYTGWIIRFDEEIESLDSLNEKVEAYGKAWEKKQMRLKEGPCREHIMI